jgi:hypothetical protein
MNAVMIFGFKVIFVITLIIGPVSEVRPPARPDPPQPRCQDFFRMYEALLAGEYETMGFNRAMSVYTVPGAPGIHKHTLLP